MRVELAEIATFSRTGDQGGQRAAASLEALTTVSAHCDLTRTALVDGDALEGFLGGSASRVTVEFDGAFSGRAVVSFEDEFATQIADELYAEANALPEVANILTSGFVDVWAAGADDTIDVQPPAEIDTDADLVRDAAVREDCAFVFESRVVLSGRSAACRFAVLPDVESFLGFVADGDAVELGDLAAHSQMASRGADQVASHLAAMTGADTEVVEAHVDLVPVQRVPSLLDDATYEGAVFESEGAVDSVFAILFDEDEPGALADLLLADLDVDESLSESAIAELGNITVSAFLDQWANALDTTLDVSTPSHVHDDGRAVLDTVAAAYGRKSDAIAVVNATISLGDDVTCRVCTFPSPDDADELAEIADSLAAEDAPEGGES